MAQAVRWPARPVCQRYFQDPALGRRAWWKEIARYLKRDESTVQRWEKRESMPVHRHVHDKRGSVYAYRAELDALARTPPAARADGGERHGTAPEAPPVSAPAGTRGETRNRRRRLWVGAAAALLFIPIGVVAVKWSPHYWSPAPGSDVTLVRLTSTSGVNIDPALSPDGSLLAYASDRGEGDDLDIWIQPVGREQPTRVTSDAGDDHFSLRDGAFCAWLQPLDPDTRRPVGMPRAVEHFHQPRLRAVAAAKVTNHVAAGYLYVTLAASAANIWMLQR